jgi:hypothetical protein
VMNPAAGSDGSGSGALRACLRRRLAAKLCRRGSSINLRPVAPLGAATVLHNAPAALAARGLGASDCIPCPRINRPLGLCRVTLFSASGFFGGDATRGGHELLARKKSRMTEHWVPVVAAILGLLGGMGGAAVGGYIANQGEQQRFERERAAQIRDLRLDAYVTLLRAAEREHAQPVQTDDRVVRTAEAEVALVAPNVAIRDAASRFAANALDATSEQDYTRLRAEFIGLAQTGIEPDA